MRIGLGIMIYNKTDDVMNKVLTVCTSASSKLYKKQPELTFEHPRGGDCEFSFGKIFCTAATSWENNLPIMFPCLCVYVHCV